MVLENDTRSTATGRRNGRLAGMLLAAQLASLPPHEWATAISEALGNAHPQK
jgi:hypothetical protein